jgi:hypothetical protein
MPGGVDGSIQYKAGGAFAGTPLLTYDAASDNFQIGGANTFTGQHAIALGEGNTLSDSTCALGFENQVSDGYAIGFQNVCSGSQSVACGETNQTFGPNSFAAGFSNQAGTDETHGFGAIALGVSCLATQDYCVAMGRNARARAPDAVALGANATADIQGELCHSSKVGNGTSWSLYGEHKVQMAAEMNGAAGNLHCADGNDLGFSPSNIEFITVRVFAMTRDGAGGFTKSALETWELVIANNAVNTATIVSSQNITKLPTAGAKGFAQQGWTLSFGAGAANNASLVITVDPGADDVFAGAVVDWRVMA